MINEFVEKWGANKHVLRAAFEAKHPDSYEEIVSGVVKLLGGKYNSPDPDRIHKIDYGDYPGTLVFVIGAQGYQPSTYWAVKVDYGSCSGCGTLESIRGYSNDKPREQEVADYMTLAMHIVQGLREI